MSGHIGRREFVRNRRRRHIGSLRWFYCYTNRRDIASLLGNPQRTSGSAPIARNWRFLLDAALAIFGKSIGLRVCRVGMKGDVIISALGHMATNVWADYCYYCLYGSGRVQWLFC
jgi:hypothetical protein